MWRVLINGMRYACPSEENMMLTEDLPLYKHRPFQCGDMVRIKRAPMLPEFDYGFQNHMREKHVGEIAQVSSLFQPQDKCLMVLCDDGYYVQYQEDEVEATGLPPGHLAATLTVIPFEWPK